MRASICSKAPRVKTSLFGRRTSYVLNESLVAREMVEIFRDAKVRFLLVPCSTISVLPLRSRADRTPRNSLVLGESSFRSSSTTTSPARNRSLRALRKASCLVFREIFLVKSLGLGPKTTPPPRHKGDWKEPARARPVPFCRHGFLFVPATSPTFLVQAVPMRWAARYATTVRRPPCVPLPVSILGHFARRSPRPWPRGS